MRFYTSLHLETTDLEAVRTRLAALLEPGLDGYVVASGGWASVYTARFEEQSVDDLDAVAGPLSGFGRGVAFVVNDDASLAVLAYRHGRRLAAHADDPELFGLSEAALGNLPALAGGLGLPLEGVTAALTGGSASAKVAGLAALLGVQMELATAGFDDLFELDEDGELPPEIEPVLGPEGEPPGLREYFGRSEDE